MTGEDVADEEELMGAGKDAAVKAAKGKLLSHIVKRNVMQVRLCMCVCAHAREAQQAPARGGAGEQVTSWWQNVVPTMAALKHVLEQAQSPLLGALMTSLANVLKDYRPEIEDMLASNRQLAAELQFDLRQQEVKEEEEAAASAAAAAESKLLQRRVAQDLAEEAGASVGTPRKDSCSTQGQGSGSGLAAPAPGSVMKKGVMPPPCFLSPAAAKAVAGKSETPLSIPRLARAGASKAGEEEHGCQRATRARRRSGKEDRENVPVQ